MFDNWKSQIPTNWTDNPDVAAVHTAAASDTADPSSRTCTVEIAWSQLAPESVDFLPDALDDYSLVKTDVKSARNTTSIQFTLQPLAGKTPDPLTLQAVVGYLDGGENRRGIIILVALPPQPANNH